MIAVPALLAVSLPDNPAFADNLQFQITGLIVVIFTLGSLALLVALIGKIFIALDRRRAPAAAPAAVTAAPAAAGGTIPPPVFAAIAAAVSTALGDSRFTIHGVQAVDPRDNMAWGAEGRRTIYATRKVR
mgnify:CR=1 FL=1|jgi:hypothetical protein